MNKRTPSKKGIATRSVRAGLESDAQHGSVVPPIYLSTNFAFEGFRQPRQYDYTRSGNPTRDQLAGALTDLEGGAGAVITCTGLAAITLILAYGDERGRRAHLCGIHLVQIDGLTQREE